MSKPQGGITLKLLVNTFLRLKEMEENRSKDRFKLIDEAYLLLKNCRDQLRILREVDREQIAHNRQELRIMNQKKVPFNDALKEILGQKDTRHYRKRFEKYVRESGQTVICGGHFELGVPITLIPKLQEGFQAWNQANTHRSKVQNARKPRAQKIRRNSKNSA